MEFVEVMNKALKMCYECSKCTDCPLCPHGPFTCWYILVYKSKEAEKAIIDYFRRKENAVE